MQYDGLLVLYYVPTGYRLWQQGSDKARRAKFVEENGLWKFALQSWEKKNIWETPISKPGNPKLFLEDDGNLVFMLLASLGSGTVWESGTSNKAYCPGNPNRLLATMYLLIKVIFPEKAAD